MLQLSSKGYPRRVKIQPFSPKNGFGSHLLDLLIYGRRFGTIFMDFVQVLGSIFMDSGSILSDFHAFAIILGCILTLSEKIGVGGGGESTVS